MQTLSIMYLILFLCRCPIMCHLISEGSSGYFSRISCGLFSPNSRIPSSYASISIGTGFVLLTAISRTSRRSLPERSQAAHILCSTNARFSLIMIVLLFCNAHAFFISIQSGFLQRQMHSVRYNRKQQDHTYYCSPQCSILHSRQ